MFKIPSNLLFKFYNNYSKFEKKNNKLIFIFQSSKDLNFITKKSKILIDFVNKNNIDNIKSF